MNDDDRKAGAIMRTMKCKGALLRSFSWKVARPLEHLRICCPFVNQNPFPLNLELSLYYPFVHMYHVSNEFTMACMSAAWATAKVAVPRVLARAAEDWAAARASWSSSGAAAPPHTADHSRSQQ